MPGQVGIWGDWHRDTDGPDCLQVPCDPKMLVAVLQPEKLAAFNITTLEQDMRQDLIVEPDLGIPISLLDTERYAVPDHRPPLAPEDAVLLAVSPFHA